MPIRLFMFEIN